MPRSIGKEAMVWWFIDMPNKIILSVQDILATLKSYKKMVNLQLNIEAHKGLMQHGLGLMEDCRVWVRFSDMSNHNVKKYSLRLGKGTRKEIRAVILWPGARIWDTCHMELWTHSEKFSVAQKFSGYERNVPAWWKKDRKGLLRDFLIHAYGFSGKDSFMLHYLPESWLVNCKK